MNEIVNEKESGMELKMQELLMAYLRRWKLLVLCMILAGAIALGVTVFAVTPMYQAEATVYVNNNRVTQNDGYLTSTDLSASIYLVKGYMILAKSDAVLEEAVAKLDNEYSAEELRNAISVEQFEDTVILALRVVHADADEAARIANVLAEVIPVEGPNIIKGSSAEVIDHAKVPKVIYSPSYSRNILLGALGGLLAAMVYVTIAYLKDTHIKDENDLADMFQLPILGRIPDLDGEFAGSSYSYSEDKE